MGEAWTGERLDDLNRHVAEGFRRVDDDLRALRIETKTEVVSLRGEIGSLRGEIGSLRGEMNSRFDALQRALLQFGGVLVAASISVIATLIATQV